MNETFTVRKSVCVNGGVADVWQALTDPELTKEYYFGCEAISDWTVGSPLAFKLSVDGKKIEVVKGVVTAVERNRLYL